MVIITKEVRAKTLWKLLAAVFFHSHLETVDNLCYVCPLKRNKNLDEMASDHFLKTVHVLVASTTISRLKDEKFKCRKFQGPKRRKVNNIIGVGK
jgi:hypothetical protein